MIGKKCTYDSGGRLSAPVKKLSEKYELVDVCPELSGGLGCPRDRNEIVGGTGEDVLNGVARVVAASGKDNTEKFIEGAQVTLREALQKGIHVAVLKSKSPSCGKHAIHAGAFDGTMRDGSGVTAALLQRNQIKVFAENEITKVIEVLKDI